MITGIEVNQPNRINRIASGECLLSISLLVSNNIQTIEKCMESIRPLLEQVPSELIIVDTVGEENSDGSLAIAREYADKIVHFEWCDDFAAARNAGLKECQGQWFMFFDDDEYFDDVTPLIEFFNNPVLLNQYTTIEIKGRDYTDYQGSSYSERTSIRLIKLEDDSRFIGRVHERFVPIHAMVYSADAFVHHYGYVDSEKKVERNERLLELIIKEDPYQYPSWLQLITAYSIEKIKKRMDLCKKAIQYGEQQGFSNIPFFELKTYKEIIFILVEHYQTLGQYSEAMVVLEKYKSLLQQNKFDQAMFALQQFNHYLHEYDFEKALKNLAIYQKNTFYLIDNFEEYNELLYPLHHQSVGKEHYYQLLETYISLLLKNQNFLMIIQAFKQLSWQDFEVTRDKFVYALLKAGYFEKNKQVLSFVYKKCQQQEEYSQFIKACQAIKYELSRDECTEFIHYITQLKEKNDYLLLQKTLLLTEATQQNEQLQFLQKRIKHYQVGYEEYIVLLLQHGHSPHELFAESSLEEIEDLCVRLNWLANGNNEQLIQLIEQIDDVWEESILRVYLVYQLVKSIIIKPSLPTNEVERYLDTYLNTGHLLIQLLYQDAVRNQEYMLLSNEYQWLFILAEALDTKAKGDVRKYLQLLKDGLKLYPVAKNLIEKLGKLSEHELRKQQSIEDELQKMAQQVKKEILDLVANQDKKQALKLYQELIQIIPEDQELLVIKKLLK